MAPAQPEGHAAQEAAKGKGKEADGGSKSEQQARKFIHPRTGKESWMKTDKIGKGKSVATTCADEAAEPMYDAIGLPVPERLQPRDRLSLLHRTQYECPTSCLTELSPSSPESPSG
jgi:hypothetical protein